MNSPREGVNSTLTLNGLTVQEAIAKTKAFIAEQGIGQVKVNYRLRDAIFSRQRYWGEPFPVYYKDDMPYMIPEECLPLQLPEIDAYKPTESGEPPLGRAEKWALDTEKRCVVEKRLIDHKTVFPIELCTMPGFAGSSAYYLRYMDPHNDQSTRGQEGRRVLAERRSLRRRNGARHGPPHLLTLLEQVPLRPRRKLQGGALPATGQPGHDPGPQQLRLSYQCSRRCRTPRLRLQGTEGPVRHHADPRRREHRPRRHPRPRRLPRLASRIEERRVCPRRRQVCLWLGH